MGNRSKCLSGCGCCRTRMDCREEGLIYSCINLLLIMWDRPLKSISRGQFHVESLKWNATVTMSRAPMINQNITFHLPKYNSNMFCVLKVITDKLTLLCLTMYSAIFLQSLLWDLNQMTSHVHTRREGGRGGWGRRKFYLRVELIKCIDPNEGEALKRGWEGEEGERGGGQAGGREGRVGQRGQKEILTEGGIDQMYWSQWRWGIEEGREGGGAGGREGGEGGAEGAEGNFTWGAELIKCIDLNEGEALRRGR